LSCFTFVQHKFFAPFFAALQRFGLGFVRIYAVFRLFLVVFIAWFGSLGFRSYFALFLLLFGLFSGSFLGWFWCWFLAPNSFKNRGKG